MGDIFVDSLKRAVFRHQTFLWTWPAAFCLALRHCGFAQSFLEPKVKFHESWIVVRNVIPLRDPRGIPKAVRL